MDSYALKTISPPSHTFISNFINYIPVSFLQLLPPIFPFSYNTGNCRNVMKKERWTISPVGGQVFHLPSNFPANYPGQPSERLI